MWWVLSIFYDYSSRFLKHLLVYQVSFSIQIMNVKLGLTFSFTTWGQSYKTFFPLPFFYVMASLLEEWPNSKFISVGKVPMSCFKNLANLLSYTRKLRT
jgi:hypothetical protein